MAKASSLIARTNSGSQLPSNQQVWVVSATDGTTYDIGFDKEFVKKHLFVDPKKTADDDAKALKLVDKIQRYGAPGQQAPANIDDATLRFLKLKKLVLARKSQGTCDLCGCSEGQHARLCKNCNHTHKKAWANGGKCNAPGHDDCKCDDWKNGDRGVCKAKNCSHIAHNYMSSQYDQDRTQGNKANPFASSGGQCSGTNTVVLMDEIDLTTFKDTLVAAIKDLVGKGWAKGKKEGVALEFGAGTAVTIESDDTLVTFNNRAKYKGVKVDMKIAGTAYKIFHYRDVVA